MADKINCDTVKSVEIAIQEKLGGRISTEVMKTIAKVKNLSFLISSKTCYSNR